MTRRIALVVTSAGRFDAAQRMTGLWLSELESAYGVFRRAGLETVVASPRGGRVPVDPASSGNAFGRRRSAGDAGLTDGMERSRPLRSLDPATLDAIYLAGGHGAMYDFADSAELAALVTSMDRMGKVVGAVCHGTSGLLGARGADGRMLVEGRHVTGFSWREERLARAAGRVPFNLEQALEAAGAVYRPAPVPFLPYVVVDDRLLTGANPLSARALAHRVVRHLPQG